MVAPGASATATAHIVDGLADLIVSVPAVGEVVFVFSDSAAIPPVVRYELLGYGIDPVVRFRNPGPPWRALVDPIIVAGSSALPPPMKVPVIKDRKLAALPDDKPETPPALVPEKRHSSLPTSATAPEPEKKVDTTVVNRAPDRLMGNCKDVPGRLSGSCWKMGPLDWVPDHLYGMGGGVAWGEAQHFIAFAIRTEAGGRQPCPSAQPGVQTIDFRGIPARICTESEFSSTFRSGKKVALDKDHFVLDAADGFVTVEYSYPRGERDAHLKRYMSLIESLTPFDE